VLGAVLLVFAFALPAVVEVPDELYTAACALLLLAGSIIMTVRGWRLANRRSRQRRGEPG
jgi:hypothetical protein